MVNAETTTTADLAITSITVTDSDDNEVNNPRTNDEVTVTVEYKNISGDTIDAVIDLPTLDSANVNLYTPLSTTCSDGNNQRYPINDLAVDTSASVKMPCATK